MEKPSVGSVIDKEKIENVFKEARLKVIDDKNIDEPQIKNDNNNNEKEITDNNESTTREVKEEKKETEEVFETMTMSDFFDEFKI